MKTKTLKIGLMSVVASSFLFAGFLYDPSAPTGIVTTEPTLTPAPKGNGKANNATVNVDAVGNGLQNWRFGKGSFNEAPIVIQDAVPTAVPVTPPPVTPPPVTPPPVTPPPVTPPPVTPPPVTPPPVTPPPVTPPPPTPAPASAVFSYAKTAGVVKPSVATGWTEHKVPASFYSLASTYWTKTTTRGNWQQIQKISTGSWAGLGYTYKRISDGCTAFHSGMAFPVGSKSVCGETMSQKCIASGFVGSCGVTITP